MKYFVSIIIILLAFWACEEDDICVEDKSPRMYLKFENQLIEDTARMDSIVIWRKNLNNEFEAYAKRAKTQSVDSILVPLPIAEVNQAQFIISPRTIETNLYDTLTVNYTRALDFGSKACGYRVNYLDVQYEITTNYFVYIEEIDNNITDEETPDLLLYF